MQQPPKQSKNKKKNKQAKAQVVPESDPVSVPEQEINLEEVQPKNSASVNSHADHSAPQEEVVLEQVLAPEHKEDVKEQDIAPVVEEKPAETKEEETTTTVEVKEVKATFLQERVLMKAFIFSILTVIFFVIVAKFALDLLGEYLTTIALAVLTSIALRPTKVTMAKKFKEYFGMIQEIGTHGGYLHNSTIASLYRSVMDIFRHKKEINDVYKDKMQDLHNLTHHLKPKDSTSTIFYCIVLYILASRFGLMTFFYLSIIYMIIDVIIRSTLDVFVFLTNKVPLVRTLKNKIQTSQSLQDTIDGYVATFVIAAFLFSSVMLIVLMIVMLFMDAETILTNLHSSALTSIQYVNQFAQTKLGIQSIIDENFVGNFLTNYNESIISYIPNDELKELYVSLSGTLHNMSSNSTSSPFSDLSGFFEGLLNSTNSITANEEIKTCINKYKFSLDIDALKFVEEPIKYVTEIYCTGLSYMDKFAIDPYEILDKAKETFGFIFQVFFGTILTQIFLVFSSAIDYVLNFIFFCVTVYELLETEESVIHNMTNLLPLDKETKEEIEEFAEKSIKGSFLCSIKLFVYHFAFTWIYFDILDLDLGFIVSIIAAFSSLVPVLPPYALCIPHALYMYFGKGQLFLAIIFPIIYSTASDKICEHVYEETIDIHPYVTGLSIMMGISAFDVQGIIYGPLLVCVTMIIYNVIKKKEPELQQKIKQHTIDPIMEQLKGVAAKATKN